MTDRLIQLVQADERRANWFRIAVTVLPAAEGRRVKAGMTAGVANCNARRPRTIFQATDDALLIHRLSILA